MVLTLKSTARAFLKLTDHSGSSLETLRDSNFLEPSPFSLRMVGVLRCLEVEVGIGRYSGRPTMRQFLDRSVPST